MTYREDWDNVPQEIRTFYRNFCDIYTGLCAPFWYPAWSMMVHFEVPFMAGPYARTPYNLFKINMQLQDWWWGYHDAQLIYWADWAPIYGPAITLPQESLMASPVEDQFGLVPEMATNYPAARVRVRKSYWTGISRRRRNL